MKLRGRYKGKRKRQPPPEIIQIECPGCGWKGQPGPTERAEIEYVLHLSNVHLGMLECAFCGPAIGMGYRTLPDFATLAAHVRHFHPEIIAAHEQSSGGRLETGALVPRSFK